MATAWSLELRPTPALASLVGGLPGLMGIVAAALSSASRKTSGLYKLHRTHCARDQIAVLYGHLVVL